ncbi:MAG: outer membrane protein assembly factor BamE [Sodalis sp. Fse]|nr:MAG: outer membrane protein assembly factor BamE [Sodalis sp. Fse]
MSCKTLIGTVILILISTAGCVEFKKIVYRPDINQGNYLNADDVKKIHIGMTKHQVAYTLGTSMLKDSFGSNTWYYIFRREPSHELVTQQTLALTFNSNDILTHMDNKLYINNKLTFDTSRNQ